MHTRARTDKATCGAGAVCNQSGHLDIAAACVGPLFLVLCTGTLCSEVLIKQIHTRDRLDRWSESLKVLKRGRVWLSTATGAWTWCAHTVRHLAC